MTIIIFILVLAVLVFVHELGHFIFAKINSIRVDAFALGFGPRILSKQIGETTYSINILPFGGYVRIFGENPDEESLNGPDSTRSFVKKSRFQQSTVLAAGVLFNFIFAWLLYILIFAQGITATTEGFENYSTYLHDRRIMVTDVLPNSPAAKAGLATGDVIKSATHDTTIPTGQSVSNIQDTINTSAGSILKIYFNRGEESKIAEIVPVQGLVKDRYAIGIAMQEVADLKLPVLPAIWEGFRYTGLVIKETILGLYGFFSSIFRGTADFAQVSGPVGIAGIVGDAATRGFAYLLMITALISVNLGVINLIPFPALDGGRILFVIIEAITRRSISPRVANTVNAVGFGLLIILMVVVTYKDILKLIS